jgi:hypothetical protein
MQSLKMLSYMSPQIASTLMWFLKEFSSTYLYMNEKKYQQVLKNVKTELNYILYLFIFLIDKSNTSTNFWTRDRVWN